MDYASLTLDPCAARADWDSVARELLVDQWISEYRASTVWDAQVLEIQQGTVTYLFDAAPSLERHEGGAEDRVVVAWGRSSAPADRRDRNRLAGLVPLPSRWSARELDRGHLVGHSLGGGLDLNIVPQSAALNRGHSAEGRRWRSLERAATARPGTPLFVRPIYSDPSWRPAAFEYGLLRADGLQVERFSNDG